MDILETLTVLLKHSSKVLPALIEVGLVKQTEDIFPQWIKSLGDDTDHPILYQAMAAYLNQEKSSNVLDQIQKQKLHDWLLDWTSPHDDPIHRSMAIIYQAATINNNCPGKLNPGNIITLIVVVTELFFFDFDIWRASLSTC